MDPLARREKILNILIEKKGAVSGSELAMRLNVSRQIIVQDIALLRAAGNDIIATPQGYLIISNITKRYRKEIVSKHNKDQIRDELTTIVDEGGTVLDVIIEHNIYGQICGNIMVASRRDVNKFIEKISNEDTEPLSHLTHGLHLHTIECKDEQTMERIEQLLFKKGYLLK